MGIPENVPDFNRGMMHMQHRCFFDKCPVSVDISPEGENIITGATLSTKLPKEHYLRRAYELYLGDKNLGRASWDLVAALSAIEPLSPCLTYKEMGACSYNESEKRLYIAPAASPSFRLVLTNCKTEEMEALLTGYMLGEF